MGTRRDERYDTASVRVAIRDVDVVAETTTSDAMHHHHRPNTRKTRARDETPNLRCDAFEIFDRKKSCVYGTKKWLFSKKLKISRVGIWCRV